MKKLPPVLPGIESLVPYQPGKPIAEVKRELGIDNVIKLASNECPLGTSPLALAAIKTALPGIFRYPDSGFELRQALAKTHRVNVDQVCLGNGSNEIIEFLCRTFMRPGDAALAAAPSFLMYEKLVQVAGGVLREVPMNAEYRIDLPALLATITPQTRLIFINNPDNPAGTIVYRQEVADFLDKVPQGVVVALDEAYMDFVDDPQCAHGEEFLNHETPVVIMRTFSKIVGLAGLRIGYALANEKIISYFNKVRQSFNTSMLAQVAALGALDDKDFIDRHVKLVLAERQRYYEAFTSMELFYLPSQANFILVRVGRQAQEVFHKMMRQGVIIRWMGSYNLPEFLRISIGLPEENQRCLDTLRQVLGK